MEHLPDGAPLIVIDGDCALCDRSARFIDAHTAPATFRFATRASAEGRAALAGFPATADADAIVLIDRGRALVRSAAALAIAHRLRGPWRGLTLLRFLPAPLRDAVYDAIARNRYRWFGR